ncbi:hypothetical protein OED01_09750 [Microbacterium sp. M28]|uniref:hypothetical protein n=1 Tax=Microbacterium sp. M28 TaxID=2962064 RepID=UPI0021F42BF0|nr:hypothetical protein [Microbacterium sp. M28]UYO95893.1 hypothetical protein OED01_09750 [Microbacterium sp. M28]
MIISRPRHLLCFSAIGIVALAAGSLIACAPEADPTPTPTAAFASEEEAFAAAEEVYRAYNDAGNARRSGQSTPNPQDFLTGTALEGDIEALQLLDAQNLTLEGSVGLLSFTGQAAQIGQSDSSIVALVCLDASQARVVDADGVDLTPGDREDTIAQLVEFAGSPSRLLISSESAEDSSQCR